jgi:hypothetical protein
MPAMRFSRTIRFLFICLALIAGLSPCVHAQAAFLLEDADGISRAFDPTGHDAIYFARICAASPTRLRHCAPGELGVVISRYKGVGGYDWLATPLIPYLYSVDDASSVPGRVDRETVETLRLRYHEAHLMSLGDVPEGGRIQRGWNQLVGASYERRIYAFRFETSEAQDDAFMARMNASANRSHFNIVFNNCADFADHVLNFYFPHTFGRRLVPDPGIESPRHVAYELVRYARKRPQIRLTVLEIPLIPGYRRPGRVGKSIAESLVVTGDVAPIALLSPYAGGAIVADCLIWGREPLPLKKAQILSPEDLSALAATGGGNQREQAAAN